MIAGNITDVKAAITVIFAHLAYTSLDENDEPRIANSTTARLRRDAQVTATLPSQQRDDCSLFTVHICLTF